MKLKVTVRTGDGDRDVVLTVDGVTTVGDLAGFLGGTEGSTLRVTSPITGQPVVLSPLATVPESSLRSGSLVELSVAPQRSAGAAVAYLDVLSGPDAGATFPLAPGVSYLGRGAGADVRLRDREASRRHASVTVTDDAVVVRDLNSANGTRLDGVRVDRAHLAAGSRLELGDTALTLRPAPPTISTATLPNAEFTRSPRVESVYGGAELTAPQLPSPAEAPRFPMLAVIAPVVLGAALFAVTRQPVTLLFIALSPVIMLGTWIDNRVQARRRRRADSARFEADLAALGAEFEVETALERAARVAESPSVQEVMAAVYQRGRLLWTRKPEHATYLDVRFGLGTMVSRTSVGMPSRPHAALDEWRRLGELIDAHRSVDGVPVVENLDRAGSIGVAGPGEHADAIARSILVQLVGLHSPADLTVAAIASPVAAQNWEWLKWLPHVQSPHSPIRGGLAADFATASSLLAELETLIDARRAAGVGRGERVRSRLTVEAATGRADDVVEREPATPAIVLLVAGDAPADRSRLVALGEAGADFGVHLVWLASSVSQLPVICRTFVEVEPTGRTSVGFVRTGRTIELPMVDHVGAQDAAGLGRLMAPLHDSGAPVLDETDLPGRVPFLDLFDDAVADDPAAVINRWSRHDTLKRRWTPGTRRPAGRLRALVGQGPLEPFYLDLRRDGPHALVGGTTGSGKSEFLQTWILGMATDYSPEQVTFLLVDYKGGAAFAECVQLPHTVGLVTDLSPHLVSRALTSLRAELRHREHLLNAKGAKDIEALEQRSDSDTPPTLVIVIDEFAALVAEVPEFIDGVIDVAQRGRSLGLHLVMATQRPAGVIRDSLRANTNLRVALRVADDADSLDVIGTSGAAHFDPDTPGRAAAKLGTGRVRDFQTAFLGGWTPTGQRRTADVTAADLVFGNPDPWPGAVTNRTADDTAPRDIERLVASIGEAALRADVPAPRKPWLEPLPAVIDLATLAPAAVPAEAIDGEPANDVRAGTRSHPIGILDVPERQRQDPLRLDLETDGNLLVMGGGGSGKSVALRTLAMALSANTANDPVQIFGLDFSGGALAPLEHLPTVGSIISDSDEERVARVIRRLDETATARTTEFAGAGSLTEFRAVTGRSDTARIVLLLDGMAAFRTQYEFADRGRIFDSLTRIAAVGRQLGIHVVVTADRLTALPTSLLTAFGQRLVLRLSSSADYAVTGVDDDVLADAPPGRGLLDKHEVQLAAPGGTAEPSRQFDAIAAFGDELRSAGVAAAPAIERLPEHIDLATLPTIIDGRPALGVDDATLEPIGLRLDGLFVVTGPFRSGRTTALHTIARSIRAGRPDLNGHLLAARRTPLSNQIDWAETATDADSAESLATRLTAELARPADERPSDLFIVVEHSTDFEGLSGEAAIAGLIKAARRAEIPIVIEADTVTSAQSWQIYSELKTARAGLILQPEESDGTLFRVQLPRVTRSDFPAGRGILVDAGRLSRVHVAR